MRRGSHGIDEKRYGGYRVKYRDPLGRQKSKSFVTKDDARRFSSEIEVDKTRGAWLDPSDADIPLAEWAETFLGLCRRLSPRTQQTYRRDLTTYIVPRFGAYRIGRMPAEEIEKWLLDEIDGGLAPSSVHRHYRTMRRMFQVAVEKKKILSNPCERVHPPKVPKTEMTFLTWEQSIMLAEAHSERFQAMIYLAVDSGMRWGELIGLQRKNLDLANRRARVVDQLVRTADGKFHRTEPKTSASVRSIRISRMTAEILTSHLERHAGPGRDGLVFPNTAGNPLAESSFYVHHFKKAHVATGLKLRFHDLRHTSVALAIAGGAHPNAIQARMGHSSIAVTLDRYGHLLPSLDVDIVDGFDREMQAAKANRDRKVIRANFGDDAVAPRTLRTKAR